MKQINFETIKYDHKEELKELVTALNDLIDKYNKSFDGKNSSLTKIENNIKKKNASITKLEKLGEELAKREDELNSLKAATSASIKDLELQKKAIDYTDSEVQKMEKEDIETLIASKKAKITKVDSKINSTRNKIVTNGENQKVARQELKDLEASQKLAKESQFKTTAILDLTVATKERFNKELEEILKSTYKEEEPIIEVPKVEEPVIDNEPALTFETKPEEDFSVVDFELNENVYNNDEPTLDFEDKVEEEPEAPSFEETPLPEDESVLISSTTPEEENEDKLEDTFAKEGLNFEAFDGATQMQLIDKADRALANLAILKKHQIPLDLTIKQNKIYTNIDPQDLEDLLNIVTIDEDGNGMGFGIDYTYYVLDELANTDVDKLIDVYNNEFMNVNSKTGLISLLKLANPKIGDFEATININKDTLNSLGVYTTETIAKDYPEFVSMDYPLFLNVLNMFDKDDLIEKLNDDVKIVPKIVEYWKNN